MIFLTTIITKNLITQDTVQTDTDFNIQTRLIWRARVSGKRKMHIYWICSRDHEKIAAYLRLAQLSL